MAQKKTIAKWIDTSRWTYNQCVHAAKDVHVPLRLGTMRELFVNADGLDFHGAQWAKIVPYEIRDGALRDLIDANSACHAKNRKRKARGVGPQSFTFKFRRKKDARQSIRMDADQYGRKKGMYSSVFTPDMRSPEHLPPVMQHDGRLLREWVGEYRYYYLFPVPIEDRGDNQAPDVVNFTTLYTTPSDEDDTVVAVDPGVRCFNTLYDPMRRFVIRWGDGDMERIYKLGYKVDHLKSRMDAPEIRAKRRRRYKRAAARFRRRIRAVVDETHKKLCTFLSTNYRVILLPKFSTSGMVSRKHRNIGKRTARGMYNWAHYRFRQRLLARERECPWLKVISCDEAYTSMTCGACGIIDPRLGGKKTFNCSRCGVALDRDANGARNILLKYMSDRGVDVSTPQRG